MLEPTSSPDAGPAWRAWEALADERQAPPFLQPGWISAWWRSFGHGRLELLRCGSGPGEPARALLPVVRLPGAILSPTNWHTPSYGTLASDPTARRALLAAPFELGAGLVSLRFLAAGSEELAVLAAGARRAGFRTLIRPLEPALVIRLAGSWEDYRRGLSRSLLGDLARCHRRAAELGRLSLDVREDEAELDEALALEARSWKGAAGTAILSRPSTLAFYREVARWASTRGWLRLIFLRVQGRPVAFHLALEHAGVYYPLKGGYDPAFARLSPGKLILEATLERAFALGLERYELLGGLDDYKLRWAGERRDRAQFLAFAPGLAGTLAQALARGRPLAQAALARGRPLASRIRASRG